MLRQKHTKTEPVMARSEDTMETSTHPDVIDVRDGQSSCMRIFRPAHVDDIPVPAAAYLRHAIAPGTWLPSRIRLRMHGHIKVGVWLPFEAEQVIDTELGFQWTASIADGLLRGTDSFDHHQGRTRFGIGERSRSSRQTDRR
jgi:hypothetical protein